MAIVAGIDEAGYGPMLGPLVVGLTAFRVPAGKLPGGPIVNDDGTIDLTGDEAPSWQLGKSFLRQLPWRVDSDGGTGSEYAKPLIVAHLTFGTIDADFLIDRGYPGLHVDPVPVSLSAGELGFRLKPKVNHFLGLNHFSETTELGDPIVDYEDFQATLAWRSDEILQVAVELGTPRAGTAPRTLTIHVPGAECWVRLADTVTDVTGGEASTEADAEVLRNDRDQLAAVAAMAAAYYGRIRRAVTLTLAEYNYQLTPGTICAALVGEAETIEVNSPCTRVAYDFKDGLTTITADYAEMDFRLLGASTGAGTGAGPSGLGNPALAAPGENAGGLLVRAVSGGWQSTGLAKITSNDTGGAYKITEVFWDSSGSTYYARTAGMVAATAREINNCPGLAVDEIVTFRRQGRKDGSIELLITATLPAVPDVTKDYMVVFDTSDDSRKWILTSESCPEE